MYTKQIKYDLIIIINCKVRWLTVSSSTCCRFFPLFLKPLVISNGLSLRFTAFHLSWYGRTSHLRVSDEISINVCSSMATRMRVQNISLRTRLYCRWGFNLLGNYFITWIMGENRKKDSKARNSTTINIPNH